MFMKAGHLPPVGSLEAFAGAAKRPDALGTSAAAVVVVISPDAKPVDLEHQSGADTKAQSNPRQSMHVFQVMGL